jgi:integrase
MLNLPNNCRAGNISVHPANWRTTRASIKFHWYITYRFFDDNLHLSKKVIIKGMNEFHDLKLRQSATKLLLEDEMFMLQDQGYNRITKTYHSETEGEITPRTNILKAFEFVFDKIKISPDSKLDLKSCLKYITKAIKELHYDRYIIGDIKRKHIKLILDKCGQIKEKWSANTFNQYRKNLSMLFAQLVEFDAIDANYVRDIKKQKSLQKIRTTLTREQRDQVSQHLSKIDYAFWRFMQIFFHSGIRITELLSLKKEDVEIDRQRFKVVIKKGQSYKEEWRVIKDVAFDFWKEIFDMASEKEILFSVGLIPGKNTIRREQITRRWRRHVKGKLGFTADFYSLKHSNLDEVSEMAGIEIARKIAGHTNINTTKIYTIGESGRQSEIIKGIKNYF